MIKLCICCLCLFCAGQPAYAQYQKQVKDSLVVTKEMKSGMIPPQKYLFTPQISVFVGGGSAHTRDQTKAGYSIINKGIYQVAGMVNFDVGLGLTQVNSISKDPDEVSMRYIEHKATILSAPIGLTVDFGDDKARALTNIDFMPGYYLANTEGASSERKFSLGLGGSFGFVLRVKTRLYLGMLGTVQLFQPYDKATGAGLQFGFAGAGLVVRYN